MALNKLACLRAKKSRQIAHDVAFLIRASTQDPPMKELDLLQGPMGEPVVECVNCAQLLLYVYIYKYVCMYIYIYVYVYRPESARIFKQP